MKYNKALQPTANPLRGLSAAELGRYALTRSNRWRLKNVEHRCKRLPRNGVGVYRAEHFLRG